ncbi:hypothetical protein ACFL50_02335 [Candidatus Latescibacterota bacterium]
MKIIGSVFGNGAIKNAGETNSKKVSPSMANKRLDSVEISQTSAERNVIEDIVEIEFQPRAPEIESAKQKMSGDAYNSSEMIENIAEKLFDASIASDIINDTRENIMDSEKGEKINKNIDDNFYDSQGVVREIAGKIIDVIDVSNLFGNDNNS